MGFGEVATQMILFIAVITVAGGVSVVLNNYSSKTSDSMMSENDRVIDSLKTKLVINSINYNNDTNPDRITIYARNIGSTKLGINKTDVYIDGIRYGSNNRITTIEEDTDRGSPLSWDPQEIIKFQISQDLNSSIHTVKVIASNGVYDEETFSN